jgi:xanthine dehydrogenase YagR molybdenum-binding subunit
VPSRSQPADGPHDLGRLGGVARGLEFEENGRLANGDLAGHLVPVNADIPEVDVHFVQHPDTLHNPVGARASARSAWPRPLPNAIHNATGIRVRHIPIMIEDLLDRSGTS